MRVLLPHTETRQPWRDTARLMLLAIALIPALVRADPIIDWNERAFASMTAVHLDFVGQAHTLAILHTALVDALTNPDMRPEDATARSAAVHAAAHRVLLELLPAQATDLDQAYGAAMADLTDSDAKQKGSAVGESAARAILEARKSDGYPATSPDSYRPATTPGTYVSPDLPAALHVAEIRPFAMKDAAQFRPGPPPPLSSAIWARDYNETREWGSASSTRRTPDQTQAARFWAAISGVGAWNQLARNVARQRPLPVLESARLFMQLNVAEVDAYVAVFDAKFHYGFWRPITAIRNGDIDGNDATERDPGWVPLIRTPLFPEYPCAHCIVDTAASTVLVATFGSGPLAGLELTTPEMPGVKRSYPSFNAVAEEVDQARIWGGVHFRNSTEVADEMGKRIGQNVLSNYRPGGF